jgi:hypothetical protein
MGKSYKNLTLMKKAIFLLFTIVLFALPIFAQENANKQFIAINNQKIQGQKNGMLVLGGWALGNMAFGASQLKSTEGTATRYFHEMNIFWNSINLSIATFGYIRAYKEQATNDPIETMKSFHQLEKAYLFNAGLDLVYVMSGIYLMERGRYAIFPDQITGTGQSLIVQGAFLFAFDLFKYISVNNKSRGVYRLTQSMQFSGNSVGFRGRF